MIRKHKFKYSMLGAVGGLSLLSGVAGAAASNGNLLENPEFLDGVQHWSAVNEIAQFGATEIQSMYILNTTSHDAGLPAVVYQCVDVSGGAQYRFEANVTIPPNQPKTGAAWLATYWWDGDGCGGSQIDSQLGERVTQSTVGLSMDVTAPENARSAWVAVANSHDPAAPKPGDRLFSTLWDDLYFGLAAEQPADSYQGEPKVAGGEQGTASDEDAERAAVAEVEAETDGASSMFAVGLMGAVLAALAGSGVFFWKRHR